MGSKFTLRKRGSAAFSARSEWPKFANSSGGASSLGVGFEVATNKSEGKGLAAPISDCPDGTGSQRHPSNVDGADGSLKLRAAGSSSSPTRIPALKRLIQIGSELIVQPPGGPQPTSHVSGNDLQGTPWKEGLTQADIQLARFHASHRLKFERRQNVQDTGTPVFADYGVECDLPCPACGHENFKSIVWYPQPKQVERISWFVCKSCGLTRIDSAFSSEACRKRIARARSAILKECIRPFVAAMPTSSLSALVGLELDRTESVKMFKKHYLISVASIYELPFEQYDLVALPLTLECEERPLEALQYIRSVLAPGAAVILFFYDMRIWRRIVLGPKWYGFCLPSQHYTFDLKAVKAILKNAGFIYRIESARPLSAPLKEVEQETRPPARHNLIRSHFHPAAGLRRLAWYQTLDSLSIIRASAA